ncbi:MAG TPA: dipeptide/oligopeptide/nickel ABC transporter ATP-binding protein [Bryobacteraceae bacterium]
MSQEILLNAREVSKGYVRKRWPFSPGERIPAVTGVDVTVQKGSTLAIVGRSGSGKSTLARCLARLEVPDSGEIWFDGRDVLKLAGSGLKLFRREIQLVFQHSATAINPLFSAIDAVAEPLCVQRVGNTKQQRARAISLLERVGIPQAWAERSSLEFSGGERQRLALARALILQPKLLILDEALSGLDAATQVQIMKILLSLQEEFSFSYLFITHDLIMASRIAQHVAVMENGRIVETARIPDLFVQAQSAAARALIRAIPQMSMEAASPGF